MDHRKALILSINLCSSEFTQTDSEKSQDLQDRLSQMNGRWDHVCSLLEEWRGLLQDALMQCQVGGTSDGLCSGVRHFNYSWVCDLIYQGHLEGCSCSPELGFKWDKFVPKLFIILENLYIWTEVQSQWIPSFIQLTALFPQVYLSPNSFIQQIFTEHVGRHFLNMKVNITNIYSSILPKLFDEYPLSNRHYAEQSGYNTASDFVGEDKQ